MMEIYTVASITKSCDDVKIFRLVPASGKNMNFRPGQFVMLHLLDTDMTSIDKRPYSIASAPGSNSLELAIKIINGRFTSKLDKIQVGERVGIDGPFGNFIFNDERRAVFIAGGVGIVPIMAMLRHIDHKKLAGEYLLLYSCKTKKDILYAEELEKLRQKTRIVIFLTRESWTDGGYETGRIDSARIKKYVPDVSGYAWFMCGSVEMTASLKDVLIKIGVPESSIKSEGWG